MRALLFVAALSLASIAACAKPDSGGQVAASADPARPSPTSSAGSPATPEIRCDVTVDAAKGEVKVEEGKVYCFAGLKLSRTTLPKDVETMSALAPCKREDADGGVTLYCNKLKLGFGGPRPWLSELQAQ